MAKTTQTESLGLLQACETPELFGFKLWPRQRELLSYAQDYRTHVWALGRRSGKSTMAALVCLHDALFSPHLRKYVRRGERRHAVVVATNLRQARLVVDAARSIVRASPLLAAKVVAESEDEITFDTGVTVTAFPCTARGGRGWPISTLIFDEAAHHFDGDGNGAAEPLFRALHPGTAQFKGDARVLVMSTPFGSDGWFADTFAKAWDSEPEEAVAARYTSAQMNPTLSPEFLSAEMSRDPEGFRGEFLAEFLGSGGTYIDPNRLAEVVAERGDLGRHEILDPVIGCDLAFTSDPAAAVVVGTDTVVPERLLVARCRTWEPQRASTFEERRAVEDSLLSEICDLADYFGARVVVDQHLSGPVEAFFTRRGISVSVLALNADSKSLAFAELRGRIYDRSIELPDNPDLLRELRGLRSQFKAGKSAVLTPRTSRGHSDLAVALALANWEHRNGGADLEAHFVVESPQYQSPDGSLDDLLYAHERLTGARPLSRDSRL